MDFGLPSCIRLSLVYKIYLFLNRYIKERGRRRKSQLNCASVSFVRPHPGTVDIKTRGELSRSNTLTVKIWTPLCNWHIAFFFDSRPLVIFSLLFTRAILRSSERLKQASTYHENTSLSNCGRQKEPADYSLSAVLYYCPRKDFAQKRNPEEAL